MCEGGLITKERISHGVRGYYAGDNNRHDERFVFCIRGTGTLLDLCRVLLQDSFVPDDCSLYRDIDDNIYYLIVADETIGDPPLSRHPALFEFSFAVLRFVHFSVLVEHCYPICFKNAVEIIGKLA